MEEQMLPSIKDMYNCTRENYDYNVIRKYEGNHKSLAVNSKPTKKDHYLDWSTRLNCSPGPANSANQFPSWTRKNPFQCKRAEKKTYLDEITHRQKKNKSPSPNHYSVGMPWPKRSDQLKNITEKINFADTCQYESDQIPGPGNYNIRGNLGNYKQQSKRYEPHPVKPKEINSAEVGTYSPCAVQYNTFDRYLIKKSASQPVLDKKPKKIDKISKENKSPGPADYTTISHWAGKSPSKKKKINYFRCISKGPSSGIYN